jgi:hypothetical protein
MKGSRAILTIMVLILIPILMGLAPLNYVHKLGSGCPLHPVKNALKSHLCQNHLSAPEPKSESPGLLSLPEDFHPGATPLFLAATTSQAIIIGLPLKDPHLRC